MKQSSFESTDMIIVPPSLESINILLPLSQSPLSHTSISPTCSYQTPPSPQLRIKSNILQSFCNPRCPNWLLLIRSQYMKIRGHLERILPLRKATFQTPVSKCSQQGDDLQLCTPMGPTRSQCLFPCTHTVPPHSHVFTTCQSALIEKTVLNQFFLIIILKIIMTATTH